MTPEQKVFNNIVYPCRGRLNEYHKKMINTPRKILNRECTIYGEAKDGICYRVHWDGTVNNKYIAKSFIDIINPE